MKLSEEQKLKLCNYLEESLQKATVIETLDEDSDGDLKLVDVLSFNSEDISSGIRYINSIVEDIYYDMELWELPE